MNTPLTAKEVAAMSPAQILLSAYFAEHCGTPLNGITPQDIEMAKVSYEIEKELRAKMARGQKSPQEEHRDYLRERYVARRNAGGARRLAAKLNRTPAWADRKAMAEVYHQARALTRETGIPHHVDHEIPLRGKLVSGLHVETNLQILTGSDNCRKNNHFEVEA